MEKSEKIMKNYDRLLGLSFTILCLALFIVKVLNIDISLAIFNVVITLIPAMYLLLKLRIRLNKKSIGMIVILIIINGVNLLLNFKSLGTDYLQQEIVYFIVMIINLLVIYGIITTNSNCNTNYDFKRLYISVIILGVILCLYNLIVNVDEIKSMFVSNYRNSFSFSSIFSNRNNFAILLIPALIMTVLLKEDGKKKPFWLFLAQFLFVVNLILTLSRTGIIAFCIFIFIYLLLTSKKKKYLVILLIVIITIIAINPWNIIDFIDNFLVRKEAGTSGRTEIWADAVNVFYKSPIIGSGNLKSGEILKEYTGTTSNVHNFYIKTLLSEGIIGLIVMSIFLLDILKKDIAIYKQDKRKGAICIGAFTCFAIYGMTEQIEFFSFGIVNMLITYLMFTFPIINYNKIRSKKNEN